jgi:hypothetical protein
VTGENDEQPTVFDPYRCIFLISMGKEAMESTLVERFVYSAQHRGRYDGYIVLLTDAPPSRYTGLDVLDQTHLIVTNPLPEHWNTSFGEDMPYKRFKTFVLDYLDLLPQLRDVQLVYYLDVDIIVGNSLPKMFHELEVQYGIPQPNRQQQQQRLPAASRGVTPTDRWLDPVPKVWFFQNKYEHMAVQGGQFVLHRETSKPCLEFWRYHIDSNVTEVKDQPSLHKMKLHQDERIGRYEDALAKSHSWWSTWFSLSSSSSSLVSSSSETLQSLPRPTCQIVRMAWEKFLYFPANSSVHRDHAKIVRGRSLTLPTLIHFKNSCNSTSQINDKAETAYLEYVLQNPTLAQKIHVKPDDATTAERKKKRKQQTHGGGAGTVTTTTTTTASLTK